MRNKIAVGLLALLAASSVALSQEHPNSGTRRTVAPVRIPAEGRAPLGAWPAVRAVWTEVNVWPTDDAPHPKLVANLRAAAAWRGIATHWIIVNHHTRVNTPKKRALFWGYAQVECRKLGMVLVPGLKIHDEIHPWTVEQILEESKTGAWAARLVKYAAGLHRDFGGPSGVRVPIVATDWEGFNKLTIKAGIDGDHFGLIRPAFQQAADAEWRFWHWFPGLGAARYNYLEYETYENTDHDGALSDEALEKKQIQRAKRRAARRVARDRWNFARAAFNSPRDRLLVGTNYFPTPQWSTATETRFDPDIERERSFRSLGVHNVIEGFACAARHTLHDGNPILRYLTPEEVVEMPAWRESDEVFFFVPFDEREETGRQWQQLARTLAK